LNEKEVEMTRVGRLSLGVLTVLALGVVTLCNGQPSPKTTPGGYLPDTQVTFESDGERITATPAIALVSRRSTTPFKWVIGKLPEGYTVEIDFRVQGTRKGPFGRVPGGVQGRYAGTSGQTLPAGDLSATGEREVWKYDLVVRDRDGNHRTALDPAIIIME
jgi:hypothetical protein